MTAKVYGVFFDRWELDIDKTGRLLNPDVLHIVQYELEEDTDDLIAVRRVNADGEVIEDPWTYQEYSDSLDHCGCDDYLTIREALDEFYEWLHEHRVWVETTPQTYWHPAEYTCIGIEGCVEE